MSRDMNWKKTEIDHVKTISLFDVTNDEELLKTFNWKNTQPLLKQYHLHKGTKFYFLECRLPFIKA